MYTPRFFMIIFLAVVLFVVGLSIYEPKSTKNTGDEVTLSVISDDASDITQATTENAPEKEKEHFWWQYMMIGLLFFGFVVSIAWYVYQDYHISKQEFMPGMKTRV